MNKCKITIATVCLNAEDSIRNTIESIVCQNYNDFEYLIVDGLSRDNTLSIANEYIEAFKNNGIPYRIITEKDKGLYDAMNKAADLASGEWIIYMNSGDTLLDETILNKVSPLFSEDINVLYGDILLADGGKYKLHKAGNIELLNRCFPIMHQSCFTRVTVMKKFRFDISYRISADYDFILRLYNDDKSCFKKVDLVMSTFLMGGLSTSAVNLREKDYCYARKKNKIKEPWNAKIYIFCGEIKEYLRLFLIKVYKDKFFSEKRGWYDFETIKNKLIDD